VNLCEKAVAFTIRSSEFIWTAADIEAFYAKASPQLRFALLVALWAVSGKATC
jgi:adenosine/AMP kinase